VIISLALKDWLVPAGEWILIGLQDSLTSPAILCRAIHYPRSEDNLLNQVLLAGVLLGLA